jgi:integrase
MSLSEARERLHELKRIRNAGGDPKEDIKRNVAMRASESLSQQESFTVSDLVDLYLKVHIRRNRTLKGQREVERLFFKDVIPNMGQMSAIDVKRSLIYDLKEKIIGRGAPVVAGSVVRELRLAFEVAIDAGKLPDDFQNPCDRVKAPSNKKRERYLADSELKIFFSWLPESNLSENARNALVLCLLTGCRSGEVVTMRWEDVDLDKGTWRLMRNKTSVERYVQRFLSRECLMDGGFITPKGGSH